MAAEGDALVAGGITHCYAYREGKGKKEVQAVIRTQLDTLRKNKVDFLIVEVRRGMGKFMVMGDTVVMILYNRRFPLFFCES